MVNVTHPEMRSSVTGLIDFIIVFCNCFTGYASEAHVIGKCGSHCPEGSNNQLNLRSRSSVLQVMNIIFADGTLCSPGARGRFPDPCAGEGKSPPSQASCCPSAPKSPCLRGQVPQPPCPASQYERLNVLCLPDSEYERFKQILLLAVRRVKDNLPPGREIEAFQRAELLTSCAWYSDVNVKLR